jgi:hypothetical protein
MVGGMTVSHFAPSFGGHGRHRARVPGRALALLGVLAAALSAAFVLAPGALAAIWPGGGYAGQGALIAGARTGFTEYWNSGRPDYPPELERLVGYWFRYHVAKAMIAALLLTVLIMLCARLWGPLLRAGRLAPGRVAALVSSGTLAAMLALVAVVLTVVNIQGAAEPFASLLSLLPLGTHDPQFATAIGQVKHHLAGYPNAGGGTPPALHAMISDFALYHAAVVVLAAIVAVIATGMSVVSWRRRARTGSSERRIRRTLGLAGVASALLALAVLVVAAANLGTAMNPAPALLAFFDGGAGGM